MGDYGLQILDANSNILLDASHRISRLLLKKEVAGGNSDEYIIINARKDWGANDKAIGFAYALEAGKIVHDVVVNNWGQYELKVIWTARTFSADYVPTVPSSDSLIIVAAY